MTSSAASPRPASFVGRDGVGAHSRGASSTAAVASAVSISSLLAVIACQVLAPDALASAAPFLVVAGIAFGVPHGAVDHMVPFWLDRTPASPARMATVLTSYLAVGAVAILAFFVAPTFAVLVFFVVSLLHFGRGEVVFAAERARRPVPRPARDASAVLAHGAAVVVLPYAVWHEEARVLLVELAPAVVDPPGAVLTALVAVTAALVLWALVRLVQGRRLVEAAELGLVVVLFAAVPPLAAFGVYFGAWHALRHTARLVEVASAAAPASARRPTAWAVRRYLLHAALPTAVALGAITAVWSARGTSLLAAGLGVLLALTFPHVRTVASLDRTLAAEGAASSPDPRGDRRPSALSGPRSPAPRSPRPTSGPGRGRSAGARATHLVHRGRPGSASDDQRAGRGSARGR